MRLTRFTLAALAAATLVLGACGSDDEPTTADPATTCETGTDCGTDTPIGDENPDAPTGDPFLTCEAGNEDCTSDTDQPAPPPEGGTEESELQPAD